MTRRFGRLAGLSLAVFLTACANASPPLPPVAPMTVVPDLRGTWTGTWGGTPLTLLVIEQTEMEGSSGIYLGSLQVFGHRAPNLNGVMTSTIRGGAVSMNVEGWFGSAAAGLMLLVSGAVSDGTQRLTLTRIEPERLTGTGESNFRGGPQGPVDLTRRR